MGTSELTDYLQRYGSSLARRDAGESASLWGLPGMLIEAGGVAKALNSRDEVLAGLSPAYPIYERVGLARVEHTVIERADLTDALLRVRVRWHFLTADDEHLTDVDFEYTLRHDDVGLRIYVAIAIDVAEKMAELAFAKGIDLD